MAFEIPARFQVCETRHWRVDHRISSALPGYLMVASKADTTDLSTLPADALAELGPLLAKVEGAVRRLLQPDRVYIGRYGHTPGHALHFHVIPLPAWVERLFWQDERYRLLERFAEGPGETPTDGAELTLFVWREFCERAVPPAIEGPGVDEVIAQLRDSLRMEI